VFVAGLALTLALTGETPIVLDGQAVHPSRLWLRSRPVPIAGAKVLRRFGSIGWTLLEIDPLRLKATRDDLGARFGRENVAYDRAAELAYAPNDPLWPQQWHIRTIKADLAWDVSKGSSQTVVAVIDTGVLRTHEDLASKMWENTAEVPDNGVDDDSNGYVDDRYGWDFAYNDKTPEDSWGHGTPCAGLVGAAQDNGLGGTGVAPLARIMNLKACNDSGYLYDSYLVPAYLYGADNGAKVFSMSYYSDRVSPVERDAMHYAIGRGVLPVAAAANAASVIPHYPAAYEGVLAVGACNQSLDKSWFSNYGTWVDVVAPGEGLTTTASDGGYGGFGGTSGAAPHVAGAAALIWGAVPSRTAQQVREALEDTAQTLDQPPYGEWANYGLVNCQAALAALQAGSTTPKAVRVRAVTPLGHRRTKEEAGIATAPTARLIGRGWREAQNVVVTQGGVRRQIVARARDWLDFSYDRTLAGPVKVTVNRAVVASFANPRVAQSLASLIEGSAPGAAVNGGFLQALNDDNTVLSVTRHGDGFVRLQGTFARVNLGPNVDLRIRRRYTFGGGTETVYLYDWDSASYPYGNWVPLGTMATPTGMTVTTYPVPDPARFLDDEGTVYVLVQTSDDMPSGAVLEIDSLGLRDRP
jgi:hypothetical protein